MTLPDEEAPARPLWLMTLTDLSLLLVGFFVFLQASQVDPKTLAITEVIHSPGIKNSFGVATTALKLGDAIWLGNFRGDRVLVHPLKK